MDWLKRVMTNRSSPAEDSDVLWLYVQCDRCASPLAVRINRRNEFSPDYEAGGSILRKEMMDSKCFQLLHAELRMDAQGNVISQAIDHGRFLTRGEYESLKGGTRTVDAKGPQANGPARR